MWFVTYRDGSRWNGIHQYHAKSGKWELSEGIKAENGSQNWERGKFEYVEKVNNFELVEGVKCLNGKKMRGKWIYDAEKREMKGVKVVKKCEYGKCKRNSESSKRVFRLCGKCQKVFYCSRRHQRNDWMLHKYGCSYY